MEREEIRKIIIGFLHEKNFGVRMPIDFPQDASLFMQGIIDSFGIFLYVQEIQKRFGIRIENREVHPGNLESIEKTVAFVYGKLLKGEQ